MRTYDLPAPRTPDTVYTEVQYIIIIIIRGV